MVATTLTVGQIAIIQVDSEDSDDPFVAGTQNMQRDTVSFVLLAAVGAGTTVYLTDRAWNGTSFAAASAGEGTYTWTAATDMAAGTVITVTEAELTAAGIETTDTGEALYLFQGTNANTPTTFLHAVEYGDGNGTFNASLTNTGLVSGTSAVALSLDNHSFGERTWDHNSTVLFQNINNAANWTGNDNSPQADQVEGTNLLVAPDVQLWVAGISGGNGLMAISGDATQNSGLGYNQQTYFQNTSSDGDGLTNTQRFWSPTHILFDTVAGKFFVVDSNGTQDRVLQGNIADLTGNPGVAPTMTILWSDQPVASDGDGVTSLQLDKASGQVYFTADNKLLRVNYNTANQTAVVLADLGTDADSGSKNYANELALDLANGRAFIVSTESFSDFVSVPAGTPGAIDDGAGGWVIIGTTMYQNSIHMVTGLSPSDTNATGNVVTQLDFTEAFDDDNSPFGDQLNEFDHLKGKINDIDIDTTTGTLWFTSSQLNSGSDGSTGGVFKATLSGNTLNVTQIYSETNATNQDLLNIHVDEETGFYYVSSREGGENGDHSVLRGALNSAPGTAPSFYATVGNINDMTPRDLTLESAPTLVATATAALSVTEASSAPNSGNTASVTLFSGITASDIDTANTGDELAGAQVRISSGFVRETATIAGHAVSQDFLTINGTTSGTVAGSGIGYTYDATTGTLTLSGAATVAEYASALALVQFNTSGDNVTLDGTSTSRTIAMAVTDGLLYSDEVTNTVTVIGINDAPVNAMGTAQTFTEDTTGNATSAPPVNAVTGLSFGDADADATTEQFTVTLSVDHGTLSVRTDVAGGLAAGNVTGNGTGSVVLTGTQTAINATLAAVNGSAQANGVVYTLPANYNGVAIITMVTNDQGNNGTDPGLPGFGGSGTATTEADSDTKVLTLLEVNDAPTVGGDGTESAATILEDTPQTNLTASSVATLLGGQFSDATDVQQAPGNPVGSTGDSLAGIAIVGNGSSGSTGQWQFWTGSAWSNIGAASTSAAVTLTAATLVRFNPVLDFNGTAPTLNAHLIETDGAAIINGGTVNLTAATGGTSVYSVATVILSQAVTAVNDAPTVTGVSGDTAIWTEGGAAALLDASSNAAVGDVDSADFSGGSLTVAITTGAVTAQDVLAITNQGTGVGQIGTSGSNVTYGGVTIGSFTGGTGGTALAISLNASATPAAVQALTRVITYANTGGDVPTSGSRTVSWTLVDGDGTANGGADTATFTSSVTVNAVNDAPINTIPISYSGTEDTAVALIGLAVNDVDAGTADIRVQFSVPVGTLTLLTNVAGGVTAAQVTGNGTGTVTIIAPQAAINASLADAAGLTFMPSLNYVTAVALTMVSNDLGNAGGAAQSDTDVRLITLTAVDDNPVAVADTPSVNENATVLITVLANDTDVDGGPKGVATINGTAPVVGTPITLASGATVVLNADGTITYDPNGKFNQMVSAATALATGATNSSATDSFSYALTPGGSSTTVTVTINGVDGAGDVLLGNGGPNIINGTPGPDYLAGLLGDDTMNGLAGNDQYLVEDAGDIVNEAVGGGNDRVSSGVSYALKAGSEIERLEARTLTDSTALNLTGNEFGQTIIGNAGVNILDGGDGNDVLYGMGSGDTLIGGGGNDILIGESGIDTMSGGTGDDTYFVKDTGDVVTEAVGEGTDRIATAVSYTLAAGSEVEWLEAINLGDTSPIDLTGNEFNNIITGNAGINTLSGLGGNDTLIGASAADTLLGGAGDDTLVGGAGADIMNGGADNDYYVIEDNTDVIVEGAAGGLDRAVTTVSYTIAAGVALEYLSTITLGVSTAIDLTGNEISNVLSGNMGSNVLNGGGGNDILYGAGGSDKFVFSTTLGANNVDQIEDFLSGLDQLVLDDAVFAGLATGALAAGAFQVGTAATEADDRIIYNDATGALYFDADGLGGAAAVQFATIKNHPPVSATDFVII